MQKFKVIGRIFPFFWGGGEDGQFESKLVLKQQSLAGGQVSSPWVNIEDDSSSETVLSMDNLLQALIGCSSIPCSLEEGIITFDHSSKQWTTVNTCAPSINFSRLSDIKSYSGFEQMMINLLVGSYGFGQQ